MIITFKMLLNLRIRSSQTLKMPLIFNFRLADKMEEDLKPEKLFLNGHLKIICHPPPSFHRSKIQIKTYLQFKFFFLNNDFMP